MKKYLFILLVCFAAISCNSYDDEIGYVVTTEGTCLQDVISANHTSCKIKYGQIIKDVAGNPKLSKVIFKLSGKGEDEFVDAQKGDDDLYYAEIDIPYDRNVTVSTIATINGEDENLQCDRSVRYTKSDIFVTKIDGEYEQKVISATPTSCKIKYGHPVKELTATPNISKVAFKVESPNDQEIVAAQKGNNDFYSAELNIPLNANVKISTIATINGEDGSVCSKEIKYTTMDFAPEFADSIQTNPLNYDVVRYCVNIIKSKDIAFENKISTAKVTFGEKSYPLTFADDGSMYCNINLYDIADFYGTPSLTIKNEIDEYTLKGHSIFEIRKETITDYDTSKDGKEVDGCIYLAGTKWQKGVFVKDSDGKSYLDINDELGSLIKHEYELDASTTPSVEQAKKLTKYCSMQRVKAINAVENNQQYGLVIYPAKNNEKINSFFYPVKPCKMADIRNKGLYVRTKTDYGSPADKPFYYRYYFQFSSYSGGSNCEGNNYGRWDDCYKMPIKK